MKVSIVIVPLVFAVVADNEYVWENVCGITVPDTSLLTAAGCESSTTCDTEGLYSACCEEYLSCPSGSTDGLIGYNCTGYEVEGQ